jgi:hypothetical protein
MFSRGVAPYIVLHEQGESIMRFTTTMDGGARTITIVTTVICLMTIAAHVGVFGRELPKELELAWIVPAALYGVAFLLRPTAYELTAEKILVRRLIGKVAIHRRGIISAELLNENLRLRTGLLFIRGLFGYVGRAADSRLGMLTLYATRSDRLVILRTVTNRRIVLTPDQPEVFVRHLRDGR